MVRICVTVIGVVGVDIGIVGVCDIHLYWNPGLRRGFEIIIIKKPTVKGGPLAANSSRRRKTRMENKSAVGFIELLR